MDYERFLDRFGIADPEMASLLNLHYTRLFEGCQHVVDLGCGKGLFLEALRSLGISCQGVDQNENLCCTVRDKGISCLSTDVIRYLEEAPDASCTGLYASHVIEHLRHEQLEAFLNQSRRVLAPGGRIVLVFPDCESLPMQLYAFWKDPTHVRFYHKEYVVFALEELGFAARIEEPYHMKIETNCERLPLKKRIIKSIQSFFQRQLGISDLRSDMKHLRTATGEACVVADLP